LSQASAYRVMGRFGEPPRQISDDHRIFLSGWMGNVEQKNAPSEYEIAMLRRPVCGQIKRYSWRPKRPLIRFKANS
jgi:hypothetical protein